MSEDQNPSIPPYQEPEGPGGLKAVLQLFLVPLSIVLVAAGVFVTMNFLMGRESSAEDILERVASGDSRRRGQAAFELALRLRAEPSHLQDPHFRDRLLSVYVAAEGGDPELRRYLTQVLAGAEFPEAVDALLRATRDADAQTRLYAAAALGNARAAAAFDRLAEMTRDDDAGIRSVAVAALAALQDARAVDPLTARLQDPVLEVSWNAATSLAHLGSTAGEGMLRRMMDRSYLDQAPGITEEQSAQAMLGALEGLIRLQAMAACPAVRDRAMRARQDE